MPKAHTILVLDANQRASLAVVRSLGKQRDIRVIAAGDSSEALAGHSRYCARYLQYPFPQNAPQAFLQWLTETCDEHQIDMVMPVTETTSQLLLNHCDQMPWLKIPFASFETVMTLANKWRLVQLANSLDIRTPKSWHYDNSAAFHKDDIIDYPIVLKPDLSKVWLEDQCLETSVHIADNAERLDELLELHYFKHHSFMVQEFIPGSGAGIFTLFNHGEPVTWFAHKRLREKPPSGGISVLSEARNPSAELVDSAEKLLGAVNWHGVAMVEFRITPEGEPYLMEVNTRFWGSLQLAIDAGIDFPYLLFQIATGQPLTEPGPIREGQRLRWLLGDLDHLYLVLKDNRYSIARKLKALAVFFALPNGRTRHEINRWHDLGPAWYELKHYF